MSPLALPPPAPSSGSLLTIETSCIVGDASHASLDATVAAIDASW